MRQWFCTRCMRQHIDQCPKRSSASNNEGAGSSMAESGDSTSVAAGSIPAPRSTEKRHEAPATLFVRIEDICGGTVTAATYPFPGATEYALSATGRSAVIEECIARLIQVDAPRISVEALRALDRRKA